MLHIFVFHFGFFLERYGSLENFANYAIEGRHKYNKTGVARGSSKFGGRSTNLDSSMAKQQITRSFRATKAESEDLNLPTIYIGHCNTPYLLYTL